MMITIAGRVVDNAARPLAGAAVRVGSQNAVSDSNGQFTIPNVTPPYDLTAVAMSPTQVGVLYQGLRRPDPTILVPEDAPIAPSAATVSGNVTGGDPLGAANELTAVAWGSPEIPITNPIAEIPSNPYRLDLQWAGPSSTTGAVHALQWEVDVNRLPTAYKGYASRTVTVASSGTATADVALIPVGASTVAGTIAVPASFIVDSKSVTLAFADHARILLAFDPTPATSFQYPVPVVSGGTASVRAGASLSGNMASIRLSGIAVGTTNLSVNVPTPCVATLPQDLGTNVGTDTDFTWTQMSGAIYMLSILGGATGGPSFYVFTAATSARIPDLAGQGLGLPPAAQYSWNVEAVGPWATIDEIAGPTSIVPPGNTEFEGMSAPRHFTTR